MQFHPAHLLPIAFAEGGSASPLIQFLPFIFVFAIFYFLLIAPMRKRQKALQAMIAELKKGDKVVTNGGLYGEVAAVQEDLVILKLADNIKVRVAKSAISGLEGSPEPGSKR
jgi:preprotein translocase subunit YajC